MRVWRYVGDLPTRWWMTDAILAFWKLSRPAGPFKGEDTPFSGSHSMILDAHPATPLGNGKPRQILSLQELHYYSQLLRPWTRFQNAAQSFNRPLSVPSPNPPSRHSHTNYVTSLLSTTTNFLHHPLVWPHAYDSLWLLFSRKEDDGYWDGKE